MLVLLRRRRVDHPGDMAGAGERELHRAGEQACADIGRLPRRDVVLDRRQEVGRGLDLRDIDRHAVERDAAGPAQQVLQVHVAQVEAVHRRRHAGGVGVPVEQVERERILAHQVVVHDERPDQVVGAHQVEGGRHLVALEVAALRHLAFEAVELLLVDEHAKLARLREVDHRGEEGRAGDPLGLALRLQPGQPARQQRAAEAVADHVGIRLAGDVAHRVERGQRAELQVVVEALVGEGRVGVHPGDHEHGVALVDRPLDERILLAQVEDVELVDPRRHDQQRPLQHLGGRRRVLDQLHQRVLVHDLARRDRDVLAQLELAAVGHADAQLAAAAALQVAQQVVQAGEQVAAAGVDRRAQDFRVGHREVGRRQRVDVLAGEEVDLLARVLVQPLDAGHRAMGVAGGDQVGLLQVVEHEVVFPVLVLEPLVAPGRLGHRRDRHAHRLQPGRLPEVHVVAPHVHLQLHQLHRIAPDLLERLGERASDAGLVHRRSAGFLGHALEVAHHQLRTALREFGELACHLSGVDGRWRCSRARRGVAGCAGGSGFGHRGSCLLSVLERVAAGGRPGAANCAAACDRLAAGRGRAAPPSLSGSPTGRILGALAAWHKSRRSAVTIKRGASA